MNLISKDFIEHNVFRRPENIALHLRNGLLQCGDQLLGLQPLGIGRAVLRAARAVIRELAGALQEMQPRAVAPADDIFFPDQIHGADELHPLEIRAAELGHHGLILARIQHPHKNCLDDVVIVMSQSNLIAPVILREAVQIPPPHARAQIAGRLLDIVHRVKNLRLKDQKETYYAASAPERAWP